MTLIALLQMLWDRILRTEKVCCSSRFDLLLLTEMVMKRFGWATLGTVLVAMARMRHELVCCIFMTLLCIRTGTSWFFCSALYAGG